MEQYKETSTVGLKQGLMARYKGFSLGLMGHNLNSPKFDSPEMDGRTCKDVTIRQKHDFMPRIPARDDTSFKL
ncbi:MAG: conjugal transfer protein TraF [Desulfohalobiaceae bacterium]